MIPNNRGQIDRGENIKMKNYIVVLLLICALALVFVSCDQKDTDKHQNDRQSQQSETTPEDKPEDKPKGTSWPTAAITSYCGSGNLLPAYTGDYDELSVSEEDGKLRIDMHHATEGDYSNYSKALLNNGYTFTELPTYEKTFSGFKILVDVFFNDGQNELYLIIEKQEIISGWPTAKISEAIGEEACRALPAFDGPFDYDFTSSEWDTSVTVNVKGNNIVETYNSYIDNLKNTYIIFEDFNEDDYKEYRFEFTNSDLDTISFDLIYDADDNTVRISMSCEEYEEFVAVLPETYHLKFELQWGKKLDVYKSGNDYAFINTSSANTYTIEYYQFNSTDKSYSCYTGEGSDLTNIELNNTSRIVFKEFTNVLKEYLYDQKNKEGLNCEIDSELNDTIASIPCEAHVTKYGTYFYYIDPTTKLLCKLCTNDYVFRELLIFENTCVIPFALPQ